MTSKGPLNDGQSEREEHGWRTPHRKHPWYQTRSRQWAARQPTDPQARSPDRAGFRAEVSPQVGSHCFALSGRRCSQNISAQMGRSGLGWRMHLQCVIWSRVCGELGPVGQQVNRVSHRFPNDSNGDRKLGEMDRGDSHFIQKRNLREWKNPATLLPLGTLPFSA